MPFHDLVHQRVCEPAGNGRHGVPPLRRAPGRTAVGYLLDRRPAGEATSFHLPVRGERGRRDLFHRRRHQRPLERVLRRPDRVGGLGAARWCARATTCRRSRSGYGLGFWLHASTDAVILEGYDAGVSFRIDARPALRPAPQTVISNTSDGAWPIARYLEADTALTASRCRGSAPRPADADLPTPLDRGSDHAA